MYCLSSLKFRIGLCCSGIRLNAQQRTLYTGARLGLLMKFHIHIPNMRPVVILYLLSTSTWTYLCLLCKSNCLLIDLPYDQKFWVIGSSSSTERHYATWQILRAYSFSFGFFTISPSVSKHPTDLTLNSDLLLTNCLM